MCHRHAGARAEGQVNAMRYLPLLALLTLRPVIAEPVRGVVIGLTGQPAVGAEVWAARETLPFSFERRDECAAKTDAAGAFSLDLEPGRWRLWVPGVEVSTAAQVDVMPGQPAELRLGVDWPWSTPPTAWLPVRLMDSAGRPAAHAPVSLDVGGQLEAMPGSRGPALAPGWQRRGAPWALSDDAVCTETDEAGRAVFDVAAGQATLGLRARGAQQVDVLLIRPGDRLPERELVVDAEPPPAPVTRSAPAAPTWVRVLDPEGRPLANQWIQVRRTEFADLYAARTDGDGQARVRGFQYDGLCTVKASGYAESAPVRVMTGQSAQRVTARLTARAVSLSGVVLDRDARPVAGCRVVVCRPTADRGQRADLRDDGCLARVLAGYRGFGSGCEPRENEPAAFAHWLDRDTYATETAADGSYHMADLEGGRWHALFIKDGYLPEEVRAVPLDGRLDQVLRTNANALRCRLLDADGQPWRNRAVRVALQPMAHDTEYASSWVSPIMTLTDANGCFALGSGQLPACTTRVTIGAGARAETSVNVVLSAYLPTDLAVTLPPARLVRGRVRLPGGQPAAQARVYAASNPSVACWTDGDGRFEVARPADAARQILVSADGCALAAVSVPEEDGTLLIDLKPGTTLRGRVVLDAAAVARVRSIRVPMPVGWPLAGLPVLCQPDGIVDRALLDCWSTRLPVGFDQFAVAGLPLAPLRLTVEPMLQDWYGQAALAAPSATAVVHVGPRPRGRVAGRVLSADGRPAAGLHVICSTELAQQTARQTDAQGRFAFDAVPVGEYSLVAGDPAAGKASADGQLREGHDETVELRLSLPFEGRVTGLPRGWAGEVAVIGDEQWRFAQQWGGDAPDKWHWLTADLDASLISLDDGHFRGTLDGDEPAHAVVVATRIDATAAKAEMLLWPLAERRLPRPPERLTLALPARDAGLTVTASGSDRALDRRVWMLITHDGIPAGYGLLTGAGQLTWPNLPAGNCRLLVGAEGMAYLTQEVALAKGQTRSVAVRRATGVAVFGRVDADQPAACVTLAGPTAYGLCHVNAEGAWRIDGVPPGTYQLRMVGTQPLVTRQVVVGEVPVEVAP